MEKQPEYWTGWRDGWEAATEAIFASQNGTGGGHASAAASNLATAGNKPAIALRPRGRPRKSVATAAPRKRGRQPKQI